MTYAEEDIPLQDVKEWYEYDKVSGAVRFHQVPTTTSTGVLDVNGCSAKDIPSKIKATFWHQCTNNEQLIIHPCGIISGHGTMYHHEAVLNVLVSFFFCQTDYANLCSQDYGRENVLPPMRT
jgi:hypothetical protein